jgi:hypothetical protein
MGSAIPAIGELELTVVLEQSLEISFNCLGDQVSGSGPQQVRERIG